MGCYVIVPVEKFRQDYSFCAPSGVLRTKAVGAEGILYCGFGYYDADHRRVAFFNEPGQTCTFMCLKTEK